MPTLAGVPLSFTHREQTDILVPVAEYLIKQGHVTDADWKGDITKFVQAGIDSIIRSTRIAEFKTDAPPLDATLADHEGYYTRGSEMPTELRLGIGSHECGWFRMGPITRKLERTAKGLGAAFYAAVIDSLEAVGWVFDYSRAEYDRDSQRDMIAEENHEKEWKELTAEEQEQYEVLDPDKDLPAHLEPVKRGGFTAERRDLMAAHRAQHPKLLGLTLEMADYAAKLHSYGKEYPDGDAPCTYLIFINDHDAITASFDEWSQHFLEGDVTYVWQRTFHPAKPAETRKAFEAFETALRLMATAAQLTQLVNGVKK